MFHGVELKDGVVNAGFMSFILKVDKNDFESFSRASADNLGIVLEAQQFLKEARNQVVNIRRGRRRTAILGGGASGVVAVGGVAGGSLLTIVPAFGIAALGLYFTRKKTIELGESAQKIENDTGGILNPVKTQFDTWQRRQP